MKQLIPAGAVEAAAPSAAGASWRVRTVQAVTSVNIAVPGLRVDFAAPSIATLSWVINA